MSYIEKLTEKINNNDRYVDVCTRVEPMIMINGEVFYGNYGKTGDYDYKTHSNMLCALIEKGLIDIDLEHDYGYCRDEDNIEDEEHIECFAYGHIILDHNKNEVAIWEYETIKGFENILIDAITQTKKEIEHFFTPQHDIIDIMSLEDFCNKMC